MSNNGTVEPQEGQVWKRKGSSRRFVHVSSIDGNMPFIHFVETDMTKDYMDLEMFLENYEYVGKAKGSISDLFVTK